jgi:type II pantothenate kinase
VVTIEDGKILNMVKTRAIDALTSATGAFGKMMLENNIKMTNIERIITTGVGASKISGDIFGIPTSKIDEITAVGIGGKFQTGKDDIIIVNIGTGTAVIKATKSEITHLGGSGVGGGTILGLSKRLLGLSEFKDIIEIAAKGKLEPVDLFLADIMEDSIGLLSGEVTAANFGKMLDTARPEDVAAAILNMVYQTIGVISVFAARGQNLDSIIVTGSGSDNPIGKSILESVGTIYNIKFNHPKNAQYTTAIGAALSR